MSRENHEERITETEEELKKVYEELKKVNEELKKVNEELERNKFYIKNLEDQEKISQAEIQKLNNEIQKLNNEKQKWYTEKQNMEKERRKLIEEIETMKGENKSMGERIDKLEKDKEERDYYFIISQIGTSIQNNMCKYVLGEKHFKESEFYAIKDIETYIKDDITSGIEQDKAKARWDKISTDIPWNPRLVRGIKLIKDLRNSMAHPKLTEKNIEEAVEYLKQTPLANENMLDKISKLRKMWKISESYLSSSDEKVQEQYQKRKCHSAPPGIRRPHQGSSQESQNTFQPPLTLRSGSEQVKS